jgi:hypothetical protein
MKNDVIWDVTPCGACKNLTSAQKTSFFIVTAVKASNPMLANRKTMSLNSIYENQCNFYYSYSSLGYHIHLSSISVLIHAHRKLCCAYSVTGSYVS